MNVTDFDFDLPDELIAQEPPPERGGSRLMAIDHHINTQNEDLAREIEALREEEK